MNQQINPTSLWNNQKLSKKKNEISEIVIKDQNCCATETTLKMNLWKSKHWRTSLLLLTFEVKSFSCNIYIWILQLQTMYGNN